MFESILNFFRGLKKSETKTSNSGGTAKERLHLVLMQDRANVSADFLELMKQEIIEVIKKYIEVDESAIDVRLTHKNGENGENGAPALYANIPILNIRNDMKKIDPATGKTDVEVNEAEESKKEENSNNEESSEEKQEENKDGVQVKNKQEDKKETSEEKDSDKAEKKDEQENSENNGENDQDNKAEENKNE